MEILLSLAKAFVVGGLICVIGQIIINYTKLTNGKILVLFLIAGCVLEGLGLYQPLIEFAGAGATVPISGFGSALTEGAYTFAKEDGIFGAIKGALVSVSAGVSIAIIFSYGTALLFSPKTKKK